MKHKWFLSLLLLVITSALLGVVGASALAGYTVDWWTVGGGGATSSVGGDYSLGGTIGQPAAGTSSGGTYTLSGGFWGGGAAVGPGSVSAGPSAPTDIMERAVPVKKIHPSTASSTTHPAHPRCAP